MFVLIVRSVVKVNTGVVAKFEPRTANRFQDTASGPFNSFKAAQMAAIQAQGRHTTISTEVMSAAQIDAEQRKSNTSERNDLLRAAARMLTIVV